MKGTGLTEEELNARHAEKMRRKKAARDKILATKTVEKGLLIVHTGKGKGKSTAAFGLAFRALGHGMRVGVVQFVKGRWQSGERAALARFGDQATLHTMGEGFTWETQDRARDIAAARAAWDKAKALLADDEHRLVLLDELNIVLRYDYLPLDEVLEVLRNKPRDTHVIVTGRNDDFGGNFNARLFGALEFNHAHLAERPISDAAPQRPNRDVRHRRRVADGQEVLHMAPPTLHEILRKPTKLSTGVDNGVGEGDQRVQTIRHAHRALLELRPVERQRAAHVSRERRVDAQTRESLQHVAAERGAEPDVVEKFRAGRDDHRVAARRRPFFEERSR